MFAEFKELLGYVAQRVTTYTEHESSSSKQIFFPGFPSRSISSMTSPHLRTAASPHLRVFDDNFCLTELILAL